MPQVFIALGSNLGKREEYLKRAVLAMQQQEQMQLTKLSPVYETAPVGVTDQPHFLNMVSEWSTDYGPEKMLEVLHRIEHELERIREERWGPRTVDLDILIYDEENINKEHLIIPHPRLTERAFVLVPFFDIAPDRFVHEDRTVRWYVKKLPEKERADVVYWGELLIENDDT